jgi:CHASE1-domain containing sensor protein
MTRTSDNDEVGRPARSDIAGRHTFDRQRRVWVVVAVLLAVVGSAGAVLAASGQSRNDRDRARETIMSSSAEAASTLRLAIQHEQDLVLSAGAYLTDNPRSSNSEFRRWTSSVRALQRYPELSSIGVLEIVPASRLAAFAAAARRDPAGSLPAGGVFRVVPAGARAFYCFTAALVTRGPSPPAGTDYCAAAPARSALLARVEAGTSGSQLRRYGTRTLLTVFTPVYRGGRRPATSAARRQAFLAFVATVVDPGVVLADALAGHPNTALTFRFHSGASNLAFRAGKVTGDARSVTLDLHDGWTLRAFSTAPATGMLTDQNARTLLLGGIALSVLLGLLVYMLGTGRARAMRTVALKTGELLH